MATLVVATVGTEGDHLPFIGYGGLVRALAERGHHVRLGVNRAVLGRVRAAAITGCEPFEFSEPIDADVAARHAGAWDHWTPRESDDGLIAGDLASMASALSAAAQGADLVLIVESASLVARMAAELGPFPPWAAVAVTPQAFDHGAFSQAEVDAVADDARTRRVLVDARARLGVTRELPSLVAWSRAPRALLLTSPHFSLPTAGRFPELVQTGFVWAEHEAVAPPLDAELEAFLSAGEAPLVLSLSSQPLAEPRPLLRAVVDGAARAGLRVVVQRGWAGLAPEMLAAPSPHAYFIGRASHRELLQRGCAVVSHGGIGTTVRALRTGRPALVFPFGNDQFYNAKRVVELGVGAAMHPHRLSADGVARVLRERVLTDDTLARAQRLGRALTSERGVTEAVACIERWLAELGVPHPCPETSLAE